MIKQNSFNLEKLFTTLKKKKKANPKISYTASLYQAGKEKINKKIMEEAFELTQAKNKQEFISEFCDLLYHSFVLLNQQNISLSTIEKEMLKRTKLSGIVEKNSRLKK